MTAEHATSTTTSTTTTTDLAVEDEQRRVDDLFDRRDELLTAVRQELSDLVTGSRRDRVEREARARLAGRRRVELERAERGLCFGRLDREDGGRLHVGRVGLPAREQDADPLLLDWRAPAARAFYTATAARPEGLRSRRHIRLDGRRVAGVDDESFAEGAPNGDLVGGAALLAALDARRTGRMGDVVATLQREQDDVIRAPERGCLVVQGGPGTGKTAVALHRAAYLLFTYPVLAERGVLVVGPSDAFVDYIAQVLPSLGETQVVTTTVDRLVPGVRATRSDDATVAGIKGRALWADVLGRLAAGLRPQPADLAVPYEGEVVTIPQAVLADAIAGATAGGRTYRETGAALRRRLIVRLAQAVADRTVELLAEAERGFEDVLGRVDADREKDDRVAPRGADRGVEVDGVASESELEQLRTRLQDDAGVAAALDGFWPVLDPDVLLAELLADDDRLARLAPELAPGERDVVRRSVGDGWSSADVALLDELSALIGRPGEDDAPPASAADGPVDRDLAEVALADRRWTYGHVIADEAQELSAMEWRMLTRRCPAGSFTVVGDVNQTEASAGTRTWAGVLDPVFGGRWRQSELTISYRTPQETMAATGPVLAAAGSTVPPPRAVRSNGVLPWRRTVDDLGAAARAGVEELAGRWPGGQVAVIAPDPAALGPVPGATVLTSVASKGLEFDAVLVVDPHRIVAGTRGWNALYVAMTRCTQELGVLALGPGPSPLELVEVS